MHTKLLRELLHDLNNIMAGAQGSLENVQLCDITPGPSRDAYLAALCCCRKLSNRLHSAREELHSTYRRDYAIYKGDPALQDRTGHPLYLKSKVEVPQPENDDLWDNAYIGIVISTTRGDGLVTVRDTADNCWDVEAARVELIQ